MKVYQDFPTYDSRPEIDHTKSPQEMTCCIRGEKRASKVDASKNVFVLGTKVTKTCPTLISGQGTTCTTHQYESYTL